jgi:hypothetical protein
MRAITQTEAVNYIRKLLRERRLDLPSRNLARPDNQRWVIFEHKGKQLGVDSASGVWISEREGDWQCMAMPCTVSGAIQAVDFLANA